jgi:hypothetical protein
MPMRSASLASGVLRCVYVQQGAVPRHRLIDGAAVHARTPAAAYSLLILQ